MCWVVFHSTRIAGTHNGNKMDFHFVLFKQCSDQTFSDAGLEVCYTYWLPYLVFLNLSRLYCMCCCSSVWTAEMMSLKVLYVSCGSSITNVEYSSCSGPSYTDLLPHASEKKQNQFKFFIRMNWLKNLIQWHVCHHLNIFTMCHSLCFIKTYLSIRPEFS